MQNTLHPKTNEPKIVMIGDSLAGKTSIIIQLIKKTFDNSIEPTIGVSYAPTTIETENGPVTVKVWDTAGQERFRNLVPIYLRNADAAILVIDLTSPDSYDHRFDWINCVEEANQNRTKIYIVANKIDLESKIQPEEIEMWAKEDAYKFFITTAKDHESVKAVFSQIVRDLEAEGKVFATPITEPIREPRTHSNSCC
ncbi:Ras-related protein RHN1 [Tritrichomonas foetus]|uniref:Ras-related protein RHN1 n=1 Tax=Tritrichomonas foetus TaxID=1144522 RepID=A0A1J4J809_9EUKA|nr:Ras-related protein RHN1 [Tritrichomonas foetus]|eukprot:OHS94375.1 Ras-related protein RHN1 [Tritrichomonas foetus]